MQGICAYALDLSFDALNAVLGTKNKDVALMEVPEDLLLLREEVRELYISGLSGAVPVWLGEFAHLEVLQLYGGFKNMDSEDD